MNGTRNPTAERRLRHIGAHLTASADTAQHELEMQYTSAVLRELLARSQPAKKSMNVEEFKSLVGKEVGVSNWIRITQDRVDAFADATGDHQWIHIDVERAKKESPFGGPVAHGFLTLSLMPLLNAEAMPRIEGIKAGINYGLNKVRFVTPVPVGASVRARTVLQEYTLLSAGLIQAVVQVTFEVEGQSKPAAVCEWVIRWYS